MRALFVVQPLIMHNRPFHYWAWLDYCVDFANALRGAGWSVRVAMNEMLATRATAPRAAKTVSPPRGYELPSDEVIALAQEPIRRLFQAPNVAIVSGLHHRTFRREQVEGYAALMRAAAGDFVPDVVMTLSPAEPLRVAYPDALVLSLETGAYSRGPYPTSLFVDPMGLWDHSVPARCAPELFARESPPAERALLARFRERFGRFFRLTSPFGPLEAELRSQVDRVGLLPLQFGGEPGFDANGPFRNQGELLFHVLEHLPEDVGLLVVEHPTAHWLGGDVIDAETHEYLAARYPRLRFVDFRAAPQAGQILLHHADFLISVSSSLGWQALLFEKPLIVLGSSQLAPYATLRTMESFPSALPPPDPRLDPVLGWLLTSYFVPLELLTRPGWLSSHLVRALERKRAGRTGLDLVEPIGSEDELSSLLFQKLDQLTAASLEARLQNGTFEGWSRGRGPFGAGEEGPNGWFLLDFAGGDVKVQMGTPVGGSSRAARIARSRAGKGPSFFLQRVPDVTSCAGRAARLRFRARSDRPTQVLAYLYLQINDGAPCMGSQAQRFRLQAHWSELEHFALMPPLGPRVPGPGNHVEVVFALPAEAGAASFELADVALEPVPI